MKESTENYKSFKPMPKFNLNTKLNMGIQKSETFQKPKTQLNNQMMINEKKEQKKALDKIRLSYCQNPIEYLDHLAKKYFHENINALGGLEIKKELKEKFQKICNQIEGHIHDYTINKEREIEELKNILQKKSNGDYIPINQNDITNLNNKNNKPIQKNNLSSEPMTIDDKEFLKRLIGNQDLNGVTINMDPLYYVNKSKNSKLNENNLYINALSCLKGNKLITPKSNFLVVKELGLNDFDHDKIIDTQNYKDLKNKMKIEIYNKQIMENAKNNKNKNEKIKLEDLISYSNNAIRNMEQIQKEKKDLINTLKRELNQNYEKKAIELALQKLSICEKSLSQYKNVDNNNNYNNNIPEISLIDWKKRKEMLDKEYNDTQTKVDNFLKGRGASLSKPIKTKKSKNKKIKRNKSAHPYSILKK